ncbi:MAG: diaminopimelate epimerase [Candidatus Gastranaerophilales bacterium]|nr:diaminopimelate epimerase [Candidatus Gastranaerophilales bacterium]
MENSINFVKMHGIGNDFILVEDAEIKKNNLNYNTLAIKMCDRNFGVGADGLIIINPEDMKSTTDTAWRIFNSDGTEPQMCGNGIRCFAKYIKENNIIKKNKFTVNTLAGVITPEILADGRVKVDMGAPILDSKKIPTNIETNKVLEYLVEIGDKKFKINAVSMGNPHCIIFTDEDTKKLALEYGSLLEKSEFFPEKTNVEFVKIISKNHIKIDVWERGCGITLACGTGSCATVVAAISNNLTENKVLADLPGGQLEIEWNCDNLGNHVFMTGNAEIVFEGKYFF